MAEDRENHLWRILVRRNRVNNVVVVSVVAVEVVVAVAERKFIRLKES